MKISFDQSRVPVYLKDVEGGSCILSAAVPDKALFVPKHERTSTLLDEPEEYRWVYDLEDGTPHKLSANEAVTLITETKNSRPPFFLQPYVEVMKSLGIRDAAAFSEIQKYCRRGNSIEAVQLLKEKSELSVTEVKDLINKHYSFLCNAPVLLEAQVNKLQGYIDIEGEQVNEYTTLK